ncbi:MAG: CCA tRNA nucleotidyltransferase [Rhodobacteraceae bacterium]|nr:CCA tRNA nucleotidyltransferase [Paracoccaceae bacterium]
MNDAAVTRVMAALGAPETDARFVGGCVRDALLGRPVGDIDIATPDTPEAVTEKLERAGLRVIPTGLAHGTVTAVADGRNFEITTLRRDTACDGRHAAVEFTTDWHEDASRRDFTMNAMSLSLDGTLHDDFKGASDARVGRLRFVGDPRARIAEDYLRILRLFRFHAWYGQKPIAPSILEACREARENLTRLSGERIGSELVKLLSAPNPVLAVAAMQSCGVIGVLFPEAQGPSVLLKLVMVERAYRVEPDWRARLASIVPDRLTISDLQERLKLSNADAETIALLRAPLPVIAQDMPTLALDAALYRSGAECVRGRAALAAAHGRQLAGWAPVFKAIAGWEPQPIPVGGDDVIALGVAPGPEVGRLLAVAENAWIGSGFSATRDQLLAEVKDNIKAC